MQYVTSEDDPLALSDPFIMEILQKGGISGQLKISHFIITLTTNGTYLEKRVPNFLKNLSSNFFIFFKQFTFYVERRTRLLATLHILTFY